MAPFKMTVISTALYPILHIFPNMPKIYLYFCYYLIKTDVFDFFSAKHSQMHRKFHGQREAFIETGRQLSVASTCAFESITPVNP